MTDPAVVVRGLGKKFLRYPAERHYRLKQWWATGGWRKQTREFFWCLRDVWLEIPRGQMYGIIGANGSGKSTLLRLIGGVGRPDEGTISIAGRVGALFELGTGFHPELTGRDNIYISGVVAGLTRQQIAERFDEIVAFSELRDFLDNPLRTYSAGMKMRLAFAVETNIDPDILLIDEVLYVGDLAFQSHCLERIEQFQQKGCTILLVSHDLEQVEKFCDGVLWLRNGLVKACGDPQEVVQAYREEMSHETRRRTPQNISTDPQAVGAPLELNKNRFGSLEVEILGVRLSGPGGIQHEEYKSGDPLRVEISYQANIATKKPFFGVTISDEEGHICCEIISERSRFSLEGSRQKGTVALEIQRLDLRSGKYFVDVGIYEKNWEYAYDYHWHAYPLLIGPASDQKGILWPPHHWKWVGEVQ